MQSRRGAGRRATTPNSSRALPRVFKVEKRRSSQGFRTPPAMAFLALAAITTGRGVGTITTAPPSAATPHPCSSGAATCSPAPPAPPLHADGPPNWGVPVSARTSPAIAGAASGGYQAAIQTTAGNLFTVGTSPGGPWPLGLKADTSPAIAGLPGGGYEMAFQSNSGNLWTVGTAGSGGWPVGMMPGTSPSIAGLPGGGYEVAFQANSGGLWTVGPLANGGWPVGMMPGTSPSIAALPGGGYEVAFQSNSGNLWTVGTAGSGSWPLGMMRGTSPSITGLPGGGYEVAFQSNSGGLFTVGTGGSGAWPVGMMPGTSPSITSVPGGFEVAFQANTGGVWTVGAAGSGGWPVGMMAGTSPSVTGLAGGGYEIAFQANTGALWTIGSAPVPAPPAPAPAPPTPPAHPAPPAAATLASAEPPSGSTGLDLSQYQCGDIPAAHFAISVVQVSGGGINRAPNACYGAEAAWAGPALQDYIYMNGLPPQVPVEATNGPAGSCGSNGSCLGYNFGWAWAQHWISYANSTGPAPRHWWLDVETGSGWTDVGTNNWVIRGAIDAFHSRRLPVGIYSNATQWNRITGGLVIPGIELWVPGAGNVSGPGYTATSFCADPAESFAGGHVKYVQYGYTGNYPGAWAGPASPYDLDYSC